jgi:hypothetical protein
MANPICDLWSDIKNILAEMTREIQFLMGDDKEKLESLKKQELFSGNGKIKSKEFERDYLKALKNVKLQMKKYDDLEKISHSISLIQNTKTQFSTEFLQFLHEQLWLNLSYLLYIRQIQQSHQPQQLVQQQNLDDEILSLKEDLKKMEIKEQQLLRYENEPDLLYFPEHFIAFQKCHENDMSPEQTEIQHNLSQVRSNMEHLCIPN